MSIDLYLVKVLDSLDDKTLNRAMCFLPFAIKEKIKSFYHKEDKVRSLLGYMMLKKILEYDQYSNAISFTKYGKPFIRDQEYFHFNISHSRNWVVLAVSKEEVGVDVEYVKPVCLETMEGALTKKEYEKLKSLSNHEAIKYFYMIWTIKESYLKMIGKGLSLSPNRLQTNVYAKKPTIMLDGKQQNVNIQTFQIESSYQISLCVREGGNIQIETLDAKKLLKDLIKKEEKYK